MIKIITLIKILIYLQKNKPKNPPYKKPFLTLVKDQKHWQLATYTVSPGKVSAGLSSLLNRQQNQNPTQMPLSHNILTKTILFRQIFIFIANIDFNLQDLLLLFCRRQNAVILFVYTTEDRVPLSDYTKLNLLNRSPKEPFLSVPHLQTSSQDRWVLIYNLYQITKTQSRIAISDSIFSFIQHLY